MGGVGPWGRVPSYNTRVRQRNSFPSEYRGGPEIVDLGLVSDFCWPLLLWKEFSNVLQKLPEFSRHAH